MRLLVYRVHPMPQAMLDYVWDYGQLAKQDERSYITNMLSDSLLPSLEAALVFESQTFIRQEEEDCSVSLRDVRRFHKLVGWFYKTRQARATQAASVSSSSRNWWDVQSGLEKLYNNLRRPVLGRHEREVAVVLALAHCYYCRLATRDKRDKYLRLVERVWRTERPSYETLTPQEFKEIVDAEQREYVLRMEVPEHLGAVALNAALVRLATEPGTSPCLTLALKPPRSISRPARERIRVARVHRQSDARLPRWQARLQQDALDAADPREFARQEVSLPPLAVRL